MTQFDRDIAEIDHYLEVLSEQGEDMSLAVIMRLRHLVDHLREKYWYTNKDKRVEIDMKEIEVNIKLVPIVELPTIYDTIH